MEKIWLLADAQVAMRVSDVDAAMANTYVTKAVAGGVMSSNDDNVWCNGTWTGEWTNQNGISRGFYPGDGGQWASSFLSKTLVDWLMGPNKTSTADDDPRLMIFTGGIIRWTADAVEFNVRILLSREACQMDWTGLCLMP